MNRLGNLKTVLYALLFGTLSGFVLAFGLAVFLPKFFPEWTGTLVCDGRIEYVIFKQTYFCHTSPSASFDLKDAMFWAVIKIAVIPSIAFGWLASIGFVKAVEFMWKRREAAGF
jgi:hypothetical protein